MEQNCNGLESLLTELDVRNNEIAYVLRMLGFEFRNGQLQTFF